MGRGWLVLSVVAVGASCGGKSTTIETDEAGASGMGGASGGLGGGPSAATGGTESGRGAGGAGGITGGAGGTTGGTSTTGGTGTGGSGGATGGTASGGTFPCVSTRERAPLGGDTGGPTIVAPGCGDGCVDPNEECDDGNVNGHDGCSALCQIECGPDCYPGYGVPPVCGDSQLSDEEDCDDGNTASRDGCSGDCRTVEANAVCIIPGRPCWYPTYENPFCGDGTVDSDFGEQCDDGFAANRAHYDGCTSLCQLSHHCGDGILDVLFGETCDFGIENGIGAKCDLGCRQIPK